MITVYQKGKSFRTDASIRSGDARVSGKAQVYCNAWVRVSGKVRAKNRAAADLRAALVWQELTTLLADADVRSRLMVSEMKTWNGGTEPLLTYVERVLPICGAAGWARYLRVVKKAISQEAA